MKQIACIGIIILFLAFTPLASSEVGIQASVYNSEYSLSLEGSGEDATWAGSILMIPEEMSDFENPSLISSSSKGTPNNGGLTDFSYSVQASGDKRSSSAQALIKEDWEIKPYIDVDWGHQISLGNIDGAPCEFEQHVSLISHPGYLTFPTSERLYSVTSGIIFEAFGENGKSLFGKRQIPPQEFGEFPLTLGIMKSEIENVYMENNLKVESKW